MNILVTMPGKIGDCFFQLPVAKAISQKYKNQILVQIDQSSEKIIPVLEKQSFIKKCFVANTSSKNYGWGGQPWQMEINSDLKYDILYHLGYDSNLCLGNSITDWSNKWGNSLLLDKENPSLAYIEPNDDQPEVLVHLHTERWNTGPWKYKEVDWKFILMSVSKFGRTVLTGSENAKKFYKEIGLNDYEFKYYSFLECYKILSNTKLFIGINSSIAAMANQIKNPSIIIHADNYSQISFWNYGKNQYNISTSKPIKLKKELIALITNYEENFNMCANME